MNLCSIPKIIHHIAPADMRNWFPLWNKCYESWKQHFPNFEHKLWNDDDDIDNLVKDHYPQYLKIYSKFPFRIMKVDFTRLCILHKYGGIYADMDVFCYKNFEEYLDMDFKIVSVSETSKKCSIKGEKNDIEIFLICSIQSNHFFTKVLDTIVERFNENSLFLNYENRNAYIPYITGPYATQKVFYETYCRKNIFPQKIFSYHEDFYCSELCTRHLGSSVWTGWSDFIEEERLNCILDKKEWLNDKNFDFYKNYWIKYEYS